MNDEGTRPQLESLLTAAVDHTRPAPADAVAHWAGKLPPLLLDIWRRYGMVRLAGGRLRLVDPRRFTPLMDRIYPLADLIEAHAYVETGHKRGNVGGI